MKKMEKLKNKLTNIPQETCPKHNKLPYKYVCVSPSCNFFVPLCEDCLENHKSIHLSEFEDAHPTIRNLPELRQELAAIIEKSRIDLDEMFQSTQSLYLSKDETILKHINCELDEIQTSIKEQFDLLKKEIKKTYEEKMKEINNEIYKLLDDLKKALEFCLKYVNRPIALDSIKTLYRLDLPYQIAYKKEKKNILSEKKHGMRFEAEITKEYRDKFFSSFVRSLHELVAYENSPYRRPQTLEMSGFNEKITVSNLSKKKFLAPFIKEDLIFEIAPVEDNKKKWVFYFEENTKSFYYLDLLRLKSKTFEKVNLNIPFNTFPNHRSILACDGEIYLVGGYNGFINEANEQNYLAIYKLDLMNKTLIPYEKMNALRHSFGIASVKNKIFVVGGANYREGALIKCESFDLKTLKWTRNNFLNIRSMNHCLAVHKESYIFKIGGMRKNFTSTKELSMDLFERYDISLDIWEMMKLKDSSMNIISLTYLSGCYCINENTLFVFGGKNERFETIKQTFLISFTKADIGGFSDKLEDNSFSLMEINTKALPVGLYFTSPNFAISNKTLYICGYTNEKDKEIKVLSFDQKYWRNFLN